MRIIFMGYHNIGYACLEALIELSHELGDEIVAVVTHTDDPKEKVWFASVGSWPSRTTCRCISRPTPMTRTSWPP